jgi:membrane fusion protein (multidrug efflux system)
MSVVPADGAYVVANYKETQLTDVREGQARRYRVDMFPGQVVHGHVDSIAPASGQEFALLPPDNATGNFTKVVQRIPVRIALDTGKNPPIELRPGMSVNPYHRDAFVEHEPRGGCGRQHHARRFLERRAMSNQSPSASNIRAADLARSI